ncbi:hypothetical protein StoSoilB20_20010 [Arthrobacter sp. StoSoilB20]|nr:hypothetical protein StoSoilB20_20010 [Arthrobacter sp. StoSoilB20]
MPYMSAQATLQNNSWRRLQILQRGHVFLDLDAISCHIQRPGAGKVHLPEAPSACENTAIRECPFNGGFGCWHYVILPSKVMAKAFSAGFHLAIHRALLRPVGSSALVAK